MKINKLLESRNLKEGITNTEPVVKFQGKSSHTFTKDKKWEVDFDEKGNILARTRYGKPYYFKGHINDKVNDFPSTDEDNIILAAREQYRLKFGKKTESFEKGGGPFWYFSKHGLGPGMLPKGVNVVDTIEDDNFGTYVALDKVLSTQELKDYELKEKKPPMGEGWYEDHLDTMQRKTSAYDKCYKIVKKARTSNPIDTNALNDARDHFGYDLYKMCLDDVLKEMDNLDESKESEESELITQYLNNGEFDKLKKVHNGTNVVWKLKEPISESDGKTIEEPTFYNLPYGWEPADELGNRFKYSNSSNIIYVSLHNSIADTNHINIIIFIIDRNNPDNAKEIKYTQYVDDPSREWHTVAINAMLRAKDELRKNTTNESLDGGIEINTIADYIVDHYDFDDIDDKYSCINSIRDSFKGQKTISKEELEQFIGAHNGRDKMNEDTAVSSTFEYDDDVDDLTYYYDDEEFKRMLDEEPYNEIASKQVPDSNGFLTDYTMYRNMNDGTYGFIFGDKDIYTPGNSDFDWECDTEEEAREWFDNYVGFDDDLLDEGWSSILEEEETETPPIVHKKYDGSYLVKSDNGDGYTAFNKDNVCQGHISASNETEAKNKFNSNKFDE